MRTVWLEKRPRRVVRANPSAPPRCSSSSAPSSRTPTRCCSSGWATSTRCSSRTRSSARELLDLTLTSRSSDEHGIAIPMAGVPHHAAPGYIARLLELGQGRDLRADGRPVEGEGHRAARGRARGHARPRARPRGARRARGELPGERQRAGERAVRARARSSSRPGSARVRAADARRACSASWCGSTRARC